MGQVDSLFVRLGLDLSDFNRGLRGAGKSLQAAGQKMTAIGKSLSLKVTAPIVALGAVTVRAFANFEKGMNRVAALTGAVGSDFAMLEGQAKQLGRTTEFSASQAAEGMGFLAKSGFEAGQIFETMPKVLTLAAASQLELAEAADITTNILKGLRLPVEDLDRAVDVLAKTATSSNVDVRQLGQAFKFVGPVARSAGLEFEEVTAVLGLLGDAGIQSGMAGTSLRRSISALQAPTGQAAKLLDELGISVNDNTGKMRPFVNILEQLERAGLTNAQAFQIFGQRAAPAILSLVGQSGKLRQFTTLLKDSGGTAQRIADIQMRGLSGALVRMKSAVEGAAIAIGERMAPVLIKIASAVSRAAGFIAELDGRWIALAVTLAGVAAVAGPVLIVLGVMASAVGAILGVMGPLITVALAVAGVFSGPVLLAIAVVVAALLAIGVAIIQVIKNWDVLANAGVSLRNSITRIFTSVSDAVFDWAKDMLKGFKEAVSFLDPVVDGFRSWANTLLGFFVKIASSARTWLVNKFGDEINKMIRIANTAGFLFDKNFSPIAEIATGVALKASDAIADMNKDFGAGFKDMEVNVKSSMDGIAAAVEFGVNDIKRNLGEVATDAGGIFGGVADSVTGFFGITNDSVTDTVGQAKQAMAEMFESFNSGMNTTKTNTDSQWGEMIENMKVTVVDLQELVLGLWDQFTTGLGNAFATAIIDSESLTGAFRALAKSIGKNLIGALIKLGVQWVVQAKTAAGAASVQGSAVVGKNLQAVFSGAFAATAAIPIVGPSLAPGVAASSLAAAAAGTTAAGALGSAIGATPLAQGGIVRRPTLALVGEAGPEAIVPLGQFGGGRSQTIIVTLDGEEITRRVVEGMPDELRVATGLEF